MEIFWVVWYRSIDLLIICEKFGALHIRSCTHKEELCNIRRNCIWARGMHIIKMAKIDARVATIFVYPGISALPNLLNGEWLR